MRKPTPRPIDNALFSAVECNDLQAVQAYIAAASASDSKRASTGLMGSIWGWLKMGFNRSTPNLKARKWFGNTKTFPEGCASGVLTPLMLAIAGGKEACALALAAQWQPPRSSKAWPNDIEFWALPWACERGQLDVARTLLERARSIGELERINERAALQACTRIGNATQAQCLRLLLREIPFEREILCLELRTAILVPNKGAAIRELLDFDPRLRVDGSGSEQSALIWACVGERLDNAKLLLPYYDTKQLQETFSQDELHRVYGVQAAKTRPISNANAQPGAGASYLMLAASTGDCSLVRQLLPHCDSNLCDEKGSRAVDYAIAKKQWKCVDVLCENEPMEIIRLVVQDFLTQEEKVRASLPAELFELKNFSQNERLRERLPGCYARLERQALLEGLAELAQSSEVDLNRGAPLGGDSCERKGPETELNGLPRKNVQPRRSHRL